MRLHTGFAIALAWPQTLCKQAGGWYDGFMNILGISKNHYYKVGHAAVVLIEAKTEKCYYFDFGRYHTPYGYGRIRDAETDHDLLILTKAVVSASKSEILNINEIVTEIYNNSACHGTGRLHASYTNINFEKAYAYAKQMQDKSPWEYGPFIWNGKNCSRFVRTIVLSGDPPIIDKLKIFMPFTVTAAPTGSVKSLKHKGYL